MAAALVAAVGQGHKPTLSKSPPGQTWGHQRASPRVAGMSLTAYLCFCLGCAILVCEGATVAPKGESWPR